MSQEKVRKTDYHPCRHAWIPRGGFLVLAAAPSMARAAGEDPAAGKKAENSDIVGTSTVQPQPTQVPTANWKSLSVLAAVFFLISAAMCVMIFKLYTKRNLV